MSQIDPPLADYLRAEPFTLVLGGGFFGFFAHTGLLQALEAEGLRPRRVVGCSAGALTAAVWAAGVPLAEMEARLVALKRADFWDPGFPWGGFLKGQAFEGLLVELLADHGVERLEDCPLPCTVVVFDMLRLRARPLSEGPIPRLVRASCTVPLMFRPARYEKTLLLDGGVTDRPGFSALEAEERTLYHHLLDRGERASRAPGLKRSNTRVLVFDDLPRPGPNRLDQGPLALADVRARVSVLLGREEPVGPETLAGAAQVAEVPRG